MTDEHFINVPDARKNRFLDVQARIKSVVNRTEPQRGRYKKCVRNSSTTFCDGNMTYEQPTQPEADAFIAVQKRFVTPPKEIRFPSAEKRQHFDLVSKENPEDTFTLNFMEGGIEVEKISSVTREQSCCLARLDLNGPPHKNRSFGKEYLNPRQVVHAAILKYLDQTINCPHLHYYVEGYGDKYAIPASELTAFTNTTSGGLIEDFLNFCHIDATTVVVYRSLAGIV